MAPRTFSGLVANDAKIKQARTTRPSRIPLAPRTWSDLVDEDQRLSSCSTSYPYPTTTTQAWRISTLQVPRPVSTIPKRAALNEELRANELRHLLGIATDCLHNVEEEDHPEAVQCTAATSFRKETLPVESLAPLSAKSSNYDPLLDALSIPIVASATTASPCLWADGQYPYIKPSREWLAHARSSMCICYS